MLAHGGGYAPFLSQLVANEARRSVAGERVGCAVGVTFHVETMLQRIREVRCGMSMYGAVGGGMG